MITAFGVVITVKVAVTVGMVAKVEVAVVVQHFLIEFPEKSKSFFTIVLVSEATLIVLTTR